ncbi:hypothetical protein [Nitrosomonas marina]|uniref:Uncharacterized protein n=1 Tax=Nitrosomonas marina TaxID=917 RepID=A0A1H8IUN4_9PROT|nr:hypothetical protein [Nitrosomonas marina]SEN71716.1 hypothetical protein SAMN05216325_1409 [Nitrosomonas marina]
MSDDLYMDAHILSEQRTEKDDQIIIQKYSDLSDTDRGEDTVWSQDGETFYSEQDVIENLDFAEVDSVLVIYKGVKVHKKHDDYFSAYSIIEDAQESAFGDVGDFAEGYLDELSTRHIKQLQRLLINWLDKNVSQPLFYAVKDVTPIQITKLDIEK